MFSYRPGHTFISPNDFITHYLSSGVPSSKVSANIRSDGHIWYAPSNSSSDWRMWDGMTESQKECCGQFKVTYGALFGKRYHLCGTMMYSEVKTAQPQDKYYYSATKLDIVYFSLDASDTPTKKKNWVSYNNVQSV